MKNTEKALTAASSIVYMVCRAPFLKSESFEKTARRCLTSLENSNFAINGLNG